MHSMDAPTASPLTNLSPRPRGRPYRHITSLTRAGGWREHGACLSADPTLFDDHRDSDEAGRASKCRITAPPAMRGAAARYCAGCPVRAQCLAEARRDGLHGLWGGMYRTWAHGSMVESPLLVQACEPRGAA